MKQELSLVFELVDRISDHPKVVNVTSPIYCECTDGKITWCAKLETGYSLKIIYDESVYIGLYNQDRENITYKIKPYDLSKNLCYRITHPIEVIGLISAAEKIHDILPSK